MKAGKVVVDVDQRAEAERRRGTPGQDLHVAGQDHQVDVAAQQVQLSLLGLFPDSSRVAGMWMKGVPRPDLIGQIRMVGDHHRHRHVQFTALVAPQQVQEAVILGGRHQALPAGLAAGKAVIDRERFGDLRRSRRSRSSRAAANPGR